MLTRRSLFGGLIAAVAAPAIVRAASLMPVKLVAPFQLPEGWEIVGTDGKLFRVKFNVIVRHIQTLEWTPMSVECATPASIEAAV